MERAAQQGAIEKLIAGLNRGDVGVMDEVFHDDAVMEWPQFGERILGADNRRHVYGNIPVLPTITPRRIFGQDDLWIAETKMDYGEGAIYNAVLIFEFRNGRIARETAYWATPAPPAEWRADWVQPLD